jgi:hypothetical protein
MVRKSSEHLHNLSTFIPFLRFLLGPRRLALAPQDELTTKETMVYVVHFASVVICQHALRHLKILRGLRHLL